VATAASVLGEESAAILPGSEPTGPDKKQQFRSSALVDDAVARLVWLPMNRGTLRLAWSVVLNGRTSGELCNIVVDAQTGEAVVRHSWTAYQVASSYRVYPSDSPTPFSPAYSSPNSNQPTNLSTPEPDYAGQIDVPFTSGSASPTGWVADTGSGVNHTLTTLGNNVDARLLLKDGLVPRPDYDADLSDLAPVYELS
jgi:hypothetical protein